jgi:sec-independent protein translocase protein TatB
MKIFNFGIGEILFILLLVLVTFGPKSLVKTAREAGAFLRKLTKSPYWQEVWATRRELEEIPKMIAKEAQLNETVRELNRDTRSIASSVSGAVSDLIREVEKTPQKPGSGEVGWDGKPKDPPKTESKDTSESPNADGI